MAIAPRGRGRAVVVDQRDVLEAGQPLGELDRVGDRRGGQQEARLGAVGGGDPAQAAQHVGDVRAEHAAVDVRLVDHDDGEVGEQVGPGAVVGQDADVQHVGVGQHDVGAACGSPRAPRAACRRRRSPGARAWSGRSRRARAPGPGRAPWSDTGTARARAPARQRTSSVGRLKHIDLPEAVPVVTIVGPSGGGVDGVGLVGVEPLDAHALRARRARPGAAPAAASTSLAWPGPSCASRTSRPSARPSSSSALHGSVWRSLAMGCDSRGDGPRRARARERSEQRAGESAHVSPFGVHRRADRGERARARAERVGVPAGARVRGDGRRDRRGAARRCARRARSTGSSSSTRPRRTARRRAAERGGRGGVAGGRAAAVVRAGARQGRRDVARAVASGQRRSSASWTPTASASRRTSPPACSGRSCASRTCRSSRPSTGGRWRGDGRAGRRRRPRQPPDGAPGAGAVLPGARRRSASRWRARWRRAASCSSACRSRPATASRSRC